MAVGFVAAGALAGTVTLPQLSLVAPTLSVGDIMIAAINAKDNQVWTPPDVNWTKFVESDNTTGQRVTLAWKRAEAGDSGATFVFTVPTDNNITYHGMISAWSGCITTATPIDASTPTVDPAAVAADSIDYATFNPTQNDAYIVAIGFYNDDVTTAGTISGTDPVLTNRWDLEDATGTDASIFGYSGPNTTYPSIATGARAHTTTSMTDAINVGVLFGLVGVPASAALTGTITATAREADIVAGGKTIIITLTNDTWVAAGATFDAQRANIIQGLDSAQSEALGWNAKVRDLEVVGAVVRTSATVVTITLSASATYDITATETITMTVPTTALVFGQAAIVATPTFTVDLAATGKGALVGGRLTDSNLLVGGRLIG